MPTHTFYDGVSELTLFRVQNGIQSSVYTPATLARFGEIVVVLNENTLTKTLQ
jgi:hypothetical protein